MVYMEGVGKGQQSCQESGRADAMWVRADSVLWLSLYSSGIVTIMISDCNEIAICIADITL